MGAPAARSVLLTLLGEYVLPAAGNVWQETLIGALETLGHKTPAARRALARSVTAGWLRAERHGRRSRVHLTPATAEMLRAGTERIYSFGDPWTWDGRWLLVVLRVPEERREVRHQVRTRLAWAGFGSLGGGLWISPHVERERELHDVTRAGSVAELVSSTPRSATSAIRRRSSPRRGTSTGSPRPTAPSSRASAACARARRRRLPRPDAARPRVAQVPLPRSRPARRHAAGTLAAQARPRPVRRAPCAVARRRPGVLQVARDVSIVAFWAPNLC